MPVAAESKFGDKLRELRLAAGLSPYQLAKKADITGQAVTLLEAGERDPNWVTVLKLARALDVSVEEFDTGEDPRELEGQGEPDEPSASPPTAPAKKKPGGKKGKK